MFDTIKPEHFKNYFKQFSCEKNSFRRTILIFPTDPDVAIQSLSLTVFGNVKLENILCKIYRFVKSVIVQLTFQFKKCYTLSKVVKCDRKYMNDCCSLILYERQKKNSNTCKYSLLSCHATEKLLNKRRIQFSKCLQTKYWDSHSASIISFQHCSV